VKPPSSDYAIDLHDVRKIYRGKIHALRDIQMQVHPGEIFGLLGPNGAGKSTLVKIMMTVVRPNRARGTVLGKSIGHKKTLARVGYLPEHHRMPSYLTGQQVLEFYAALSHVPRRIRQRRSQELLKIMGMDDWGRKKVSSYSKGMMQRIGLAQALMNDPDLIVLDEPTDGVDPIGRRDIRDVLIELRQQGKTIFLNSHLLSELEMVCDRVAILVQGEVVTQGTLDDLTRESQRYEIIITGTAPTWVETKSGLRAEPLDDDRCKLIIMGDDPKPIQALLDQLRQENRIILSVQPVRETLEDLFMRAITDPVTGKIAAPGAPPPHTHTQTHCIQFQWAFCGRWRMRQFLAMIIDAYRELNSKKLFWIILGLSGITVLFYASIGFNDTGMTMFFGLMDVENEMLTRDSFLSRILYRSIFSTFILGIWLAWIATILALISTASIFPDMVAGGSIDLMLSKPIGRVKLFFYKYLASMLFVVLQVSIFCVGVFLSLGFRLNDWEWRIFAAIPLVTVFYSYLFSICVLFGVWTRSVLTALLLTFLFWFSTYSINTTETIVNLFKTQLVMEVESLDEEISTLQIDSMPENVAVQTRLGTIQTERDEKQETIDKIEQWHRPVRVAQAILPKTGETIALLDRWLRRETDINIMDIFTGGVAMDNQGDFRRSKSKDEDREVERRMEVEYEARSEIFIIGTSLAFEAVVLALACAIFVRRDF